MRIVMNEKAYDTETSEKLAEWQSSGYGSPVRFETLYRKKSGKYFLEINDPYGIGYRIKPMSEGEAKMWVMDCANSKFEEIFGPVEE